MHREEPMNLTTTKLVEVAFLRVEGKKRLSVISIGLTDLGYVSHGS